VTDIDASSPKADSGLRKGDVIQEVNHQPVHNVAEFEQALHKAGKEEALLLVNRRRYDAVHRVNTQPKDRRNRSRRKARPVFAL